MKTIHIILNSHIDPIWLWPWHAGLDEALATCRSACDRIDANPDIVFTRGEAWIYEQIERIDPVLFERIREHVRTGRWEITGGWYIQPDCNLPSFWAMEKQIAIGKRYFLEKFGQFPNVAYNVDSFGHAAALPGLMQAAGQDSYVLTRPGQHEMALPSRLFRWRGYDDGPEVTVCRPDCYTAQVHNLDLNYVRASTALLPDGCEHTACHGGGPTEKQIAWCRRHADDVEGWHMEFSSLTRFFEELRSSGVQLPLIVGELQHHAIGCYTAFRPVKTAVRRAEHLLAQADSLCTLDSQATEALDRAWKRVCFHHFHDTMGGTCVPSAYPMVLGQLGGAAAEADEVLQYELRKRLALLPDDVMQRIAFLNASSGKYDGYVECEPWCGPWPTHWGSDCMLIDENGEHVPHQALHAESITGASLDHTNIPRLLLRLTAQPGELRVLRIARSSHVPWQPHGANAGTPGSIESRSGVRCNGEHVYWREGGSASQFTLPVRLDLIRDLSDTWSHSIDRYDEIPVASAQWSDPTTIYTGPLVAALATDGSIGRSDLQAEWRVYANERFAELKLRVHWREHNRVLKLVLPFLAHGGKRVDGHMGTSITRANNGKERPLRDWTLLAGEAGSSLGVVCPDTYALDATDEHVRLTLLRSPLMAHHDPAPPRAAAAEVSDQGVHVFLFRFFYGPDVNADSLDAHALMLQRHLTTADLTRGMPTVLPGCEPFLED
jgi:alpha-mannosidase